MKRTTASRVTGRELTTILPTTNNLIMKSAETTLPFSSAQLNINACGNRKTHRRGIEPGLLRKGGDIHQYTTDDSYFKFEVAHRNNTSIFLNAIQHKSISKYKKCPAGNRTLVSRNRPGYSPLYYRGFIFYI